MKHLKKILAFFWQLPQILVGFSFFLLMKLIFKAKVSIYKIHLQKPWDWTAFYLVKLPFALQVSFGPYVFGSKETLSQQMNHELGHSKQSLLLGWIYLLIISLPELLIKNEKNMYKKGINSWANILGKLK